ncbi:heterokaryon incompatibility protein-domain-containing protein [Cercophora newfieldiana]|uniref:Heterokaryon incompatibility protein-domain-containing protein n=1 Tax=Cercophora newfieldiana TaxID=92897 RepID=A0AA40CP01_9PEZI|nr:heterokaryon incompatibility protein-domain-containing protein [Cercophora newfieldiana]
MWLINTTTLKLEYFIGPETAPEYAILSHTWGDGEVTFQELQDVDKAKLKPGFAKIQKTCDLAREQDDLQYAWVDTCCIDKSSSAELSESINSMYDWYRRSKTCYVYLNDWASDSEKDWAKLEVLTHTPREGDEPEPLRWFTRGWTLQELIAPTNITFYDKTWAVRGTKSDSLVVHELSRITGIAPHILQDGSESNLRKTCLGQRMSWAACRETTRKEDIAYCLLGIFQVNVPLLYGEGDRAFIRLQEEIIKTSTDFSLFAWRQLDRTHKADQRGILSDHPREFWSLRDCVPTLSLFSSQDGEEAVMTNKGLRVQTSSLFAHDNRDSSGLSMWAEEHDIYLSLGCTVGGRHAYISLRPASGTTYQRNYPSVGCETIESMVGRRLEPRSLYISTTDSTLKHLANTDDSGLRFKLRSSTKWYWFELANMWPPGLFRLSTNSDYDVTLANDFPRFVGYLELSTYSLASSESFPSLLAVVYRLHPDQQFSVHILLKDDAQHLLSLEDSIQGLSSAKAEKRLLEEFRPRALRGKITTENPGGSNFAKSEMRIRDVARGTQMKVAVNLIPLYGSNHTVLVLSLDYV